MKSLLDIDLERNSYMERPNGFIFKFKKIDKYFIHTSCEGKLLSKFGLTSEMIVNKSLHDFMPLEIAIRKELFYEQAWNGEYINYEGYFNGVYYLAILMPIISDGQVIEVMVSAIDITKEKQNENRVQKAEKLAMVGQLAAGVAHEIRNPLTSIKGFTQILKDSLPDNEQRNYLDIMLREISSIQRVVNQFMLLSNPAESFVMENTNIKSLILNVIKFLRPEAFLHNINILTEFNCELIAECDVNQIKQVLFNLVQNAIEASTSKRRNIIIALNQVDVNDYEISIKDYGKGISTERQKYLFEPFYATQEKGTGLGLMVCRQIVESHSGKILVESQENHGTVVRIILPMFQQKSS